MNYDDVQLVIPMSGTGRRFSEAGYDTIKPLIEVDGRPIIAHVLDMFPGVTDVTFICNEEHIRDTNMGDILREYCPSGNILTIPPHKMGPVYAVSYIQHLLSDDKRTIVSYCDYGTVWDFEGFLEAVKGYDGGIACYTGFHPHMLGSDNYAFCKQSHMILEDIKEKEPFTNNKMDEYASNGTYYFRNGRLMKTYFEKLMESGDNVGGEFYVSLVYKHMLQDKLSTKIYEIDKMLQWGTPYDLEIYKGWSNCFKNINNPKPKAQARDFTLVLPMAGLGSRFSQEGYENPKPLIDVDGEPMIVRAVNDLPKFDKSVFICLKKHVDEHSIDIELKKHYSGAKVICLDRVTQGQAETCSLAIEQLEPDAPILISACDNGVCYDEDKFLELVDEDTDVIVWTFRNSQTSKVNPDMYSWVEVDDDNNVLSVSCKHFPGGDPLKTHAIIGTFYYKNCGDYLDGYKKNVEMDSRTNGEFYVDDVINRNVEAGLNVKVCEVDNYICWGTPNDLRTYNYWREYFG